MPREQTLTDQDRFWLRSMATQPYGWVPLSVREDLAGRGLATSMASITTAGRAALAAASGGESA